jgi:hypothetical protein
MTPPLGSTHEAYHRAGMGATVDKHPFADSGPRRFTPPVQAVLVVDEGAIDR